MTVPPWTHIALSAAIGMALLLLAVAVVWELEIAIVFVVPLIVAGTTFLVAAAFAAKDRWHDGRLAASNDGSGAT